MEFFFSPAASLTSLMAASFLAATVLPGGSGAVFLAVVLLHPEQSTSALLLATLGNTLGGMTTYALGRWLPEKISLRCVRSATRRPLKAFLGRLARLRRRLRTSAAERSAFSALARRHAPSPGSGVMARRCWHLPGRR
jgi:membrane protein YqaA with SNARE-associated domain